MEHGFIRPSAAIAARNSYLFLLREFIPLLRLLAIPGLATALVLYLSFKIYLRELTGFITSGDTRTASLALGALAAGLFVCLFIAAAAISSLADLALSDRRVGRGFQFTAGRQVWRLYAAYLRFFLVTGGFIAATYLVSVFVLPLMISSGTMIGLMAAIIVIAGWYCLFARVGFLIAPIVAQSTGTVLRKALRAGSGDGARNLSLVLMLSAPGILIEIAGEYAFRLGAGPARVALELPVAAYARVLEYRLGEFVFLSTLATFTTLALVTAASIACYRDRAFEEVSAPVPVQPDVTMDSAPV